MRYQLKKQIACAAALLLAASNSFAATGTQSPDEIETVNEAKAELAPGIITAIDILSGADQDLINEALAAAGNVIPTIAATLGSMPTAEVTEILKDDNAIRLLGNVQNILGAGQLLTNLTSDNEILGAIKNRNFAEAADDSGLQGRLLTVLAFDSKLSSVKGAVQNFTRAQSRTFFQTASPKYSVAAGASAVGGGGGAIGAAGNSVAGTIIDRSDDLRASNMYARHGMTPVGPAGPTAKTSPGIWGKAIASYGDQDEVDGLNGYDYEVKGLVFGYDFQVNERLLLGVNVGYTDTDMDSGVNTTTDTKAFSVGVYSQHYFGPTYLDLGVMYSRGDSDNRRQIIAGNTVENISSSPDNEAYLVYGEYGYEVLKGAYTLIPVLGFNYANVDIEGYTETSDLNSGLLNIVDSMDLDYFSTTLGLKGLFATSQALEIKGQLLWKHEFSGDIQPTVRSKFTGAPANTDWLETQGLDVDDDRFNVGLGFKYDLNNVNSFNFDYEGEFADGFQSHTGLLGYKHKF